MSYTHLTENDRYVISHLHGSGISIREIGRRSNGIGVRLTPFISCLRRSRCQTR